jgi:N-formylglutamate deformylase
MLDKYKFEQASIPLLVSVPHDGQHVPDEIASRMTEPARRIPDTDWHVQRLYDFAGELGAGVLAATHSRYVIDLNRDPAGGSLYPGADNTEIVPTTTFDLEPIYLPGNAPDTAEIASRIETYWQPYHDKLSAEIDRIRRQSGFAVVFDAHSIRSEVPRFFDGLLPDFNFGTASGASADPGLAARAFHVLDTADGYSAVLNGRFTGGYITRHYGAPAEDVHTLQLELSQRTYMNEIHPFEFRPDLAGPVITVLRRLIEEVIAWTRERS